jgi:hypothetical protein
MSPIQNLFYLYISTHYYISIVLIYPLIYLIIYYASINSYFESLMIQIILYNLSKMNSIISMDSTSLNYQCLYSIYDSLKVLSPSFPFYLTYDRYIYILNYNFYF